MARRSGVATRTRLTGEPATLAGRLAAHSPVPERMITLWSSDPADARCCEIQRGGAAQASGADDQHRRALEELLSFFAYLGKSEVACVA